MIPIRDINPTSRTAWVTIGLIVVNVLVFLLWQPSFQSESEQKTFFFCQAQIPYEMTHQTNLAEGGTDARTALAEDQVPDGAALQRALQQECPHKNWLLAALVSMFLHAGWLHIAGNMLYLWVFGNNIEDRFGPLAYLAFYLLGGIAAGALEIAFAPNSTVPTLGASGAVAAVLGAYLVLFPRARVRTLVFLLVFVTWVELPAAVLLGLWFVLQLFSGVGSVGAQAGGVAYWAHVGGFAFGVLVAWLFFRDRGADRLGTMRRAPYDAY